MLDKLNKLPKKNLIKIIINLQNYINRERNAYYKDSLINNKKNKIKIPIDKEFYWLD